MSSTISCTFMYMYIHVCMFRKICIYQMPVNVQEYIYLLKFMSIRIFIECYIESVKKKCIYIYILIVEIVL